MANQSVRFDEGRERVGRWPRAFQSILYSLRGKRHGYRGGGFDARLRSVGGQEGAGLVRPVQLLAVAVLDRHVGGERHRLASIERKGGKRLCEEFVVRPRGDHEARFVNDFDVKLLAAGKLKRARRDI